MRDSKKRRNPRERRVSARQAVHNPVQSAPDRSIWQTRVWLESSRPARLVQGRSRPDFGDHRRWRRVAPVARPAFRGRASLLRDQLPLPFVQQVGVRKSQSLAHRGDRMAVEDHLDRLFNSRVYCRRTTHGRSLTFPELLFHIGRSPAAVQN